MDVKKVLLLHGWTNKRPEGHWMRITAASLRSQGHQVWYPQFPEPDNPEPADWQELLRQEANMMDEVDGEEKIVIAHSLGTINWLFGSLGNIFNRPFDRTLLVAIPELIPSEDGPQIKGEPLDFASPALHKNLRTWGGRVTAIASDKDGWQPNGIGFYSPLELEQVIFEGAGHFSLGDGWGRWQGVERWVRTGLNSELLNR